jgi:predicted O-methyltransferase YrrM
MGQDLGAHRSLPFASLQSPPALLHLIDSDPADDIAFAAPLPAFSGTPAPAVMARRRAAGAGRAMMTELGEDRLRRLVLDHFGGAARIRLLRRAETFGAPVFVVDFDRGARHYRTLGSFSGSAQVTEQSSMDLMYPARLVFHYERLMSLAFALGAQRRNALLLGVGGAAMWRFVRAYLPDCLPTLVEADETVIAIARRWFHLRQPAVIDTAQHYLAEAGERFDVILVDLYNASGPADLDAGFWERCLDALTPDGCLAANWADFTVNPQVRPLTEALAEAAARRGFASFFVTRRGFRDNLVQYVPAAPGNYPDAVLAAHERFARTHRLPDGGRFILENCLFSTRFPIG